VRPLAPAIHHNWASSQAKVSAIATLGETPLETQSLVSQNDPGTIDDEGV